MALKVSQTKFYWAGLMKTRKLWYQVKKTICLTLEMLGIHFEHYKTLILFLLVDSFLHHCKKMKYEALTICIYLQASS